MRTEGGQREKSEATEGWEKWERGRVLGTGPEGDYTHISEQPTAVYRNSAGQNPVEVLSRAKLCSASPTVSEFNSQSPRGKRTNSTAILCPHTDTLRWASPLSRQEGSFKSSPLPLRRKPMSSAHLAGWIRCCHWLSWAALLQRWALWGRGAVCHMLPRASNTSAQ